MMLSNEKTQARVSPLEMAASENAAPRLSGYEGKEAKGSSRRDAAL
jgi:hypothetical protein